MGFWDFIARAAAPFDSAHGRPLPPFAELAETAGPEFDEIATTHDGRDVTRGYIHPDMILPSSDEILQAKGGDLKVYAEVLRDDQVQTSFGQRRSAVTSAEWDVEPGGTKRIDKQAAEFVKAQLEHIGWDQRTDKMLYGVFYGWAVAECPWARDGAQVVMDAVKVRDRRRFAFDGDFRLRLLTGSNAQGELMPERKFWVFATGADHDDEPYGLGLGHWLYWPTFFKKNDIKFWLIFLEKFGMPTGKGTYQPGATVEEKRRLLSALRAIQRDSGVIIPEGMSIELIEAARSGTADYTALYDRMNASISKVVLGHTGSTDATPGRLGGESNAADVRRDLVKADADLVCESANRSFIRWLVDWNYPGAAYPKVWRDVEEPEDLKARSERDKNLFDIGFKPTLKEVKETYGGEWEEVKPEPPPDTGTLPAPAAPASDPAQADLAEGDPAPDVVDQYVERLGKEAEPLIEKGLLDPIRTALDQAIADGKTLVEFAESLPSLYAEMDARDFAELMAQGMLAAGMAGRYELQQGE